MAMTSKENRAEDVRLSMLLASPQRLNERELLLREGKTRAQRNLLLTIKGFQ